MLIKLPDELLSMMSGVPSFIVLAKKSSFWVLSVWVLSNYKHKTLHCSLHHTTQARNRAGAVVELLETNLLQLLITSCIGIGFTP